MIKKQLLLTILLIVLSFVVASSAWAHQPRYIKDNQLVIIKNPDISQAFYGELKDWPAFYLIDLKESQELFFQLLVPDLPSVQKDKSVEVGYSPELGLKAEIFLTLNPASTTWPSFYEEYAGDNYLEGPKDKKIGEAGYYFIKISSPDNMGKYVLVVGEKEEFPVQEMAKALFTIPQLKTKFFEKPLWRSFEGKIGRFSGLGFLVLIIVGFLFYRFHRIYR